MSLPEFIDEYEVEQPVDDGAVLLNTILVCTALFAIGGIALLFYLLGSRYEQGPMKQEPLRGKIIELSADGLYATFSGPDRMKVQLGDTFTIARDGVFKGRVEVVRHPAIKEGEAELEDVASRIWKITLNPEDYVGRVLSDYTVVKTDGSADIEAGDDVSSVRPLKLKTSEE